MVYPHKWSPVSCGSSAGQGKFAGQTPTFYQLCHATFMSFLGFNVLYLELFLCFSPNKDPFIHYRLCEKFHLYLALRGRVKAFGETRCSLNFWFKGATKYFNVIFVVIAHNSFPEIHKEKTQLPPTDRAQQTYRIDGVLSAVGSRFDQLYSPKVRIYKITNLTRYYTTYDKAQLILIRSTFYTEVMRHYLSLIIMDYNTLTRILLCVWTTCAR